jgi:hypothetical protein
MTTQVLNERGVELYEATHQELAAVVSSVDAVIVDAPYSATTHNGHGAMAESEAADSASRRDLDYACWTEADVRDFVEAWAPVNRGWFVSLTDDDLAPVWKREYRRAGLTAFAAVPAVIRGMTVRMAGDGPSSWTIQCMVARPKALARWGTLPGAYVGPREVTPVVGGKPLWLMRDLVRDYSRDGDRVADPCCGGGGLGLAAIAMGRTAVLGDRDHAHVEIAAERLRSLPVMDRRGTLALFGT